MTYIKAKYKQAIYKSENGYIIGLCKVIETDNSEFLNYIDKTITFTGNFYELIEDDLYFFQGEDVIHPKYGLQFKVNNYERIKPSDCDGIIKFLSSDLFKGIGESIAKKIVKELGNNTLELILEDSNNLLRVPRLSEKKAKLIYDTLNKYEESHKIIVYLNELGFSMPDSLKIYNKYKNRTMQIIEYNIYDLIEIDDITFNKIDIIRKKLNIDDDDIRRIKACIIYIITEITYTNGDTYLVYSDIAKNLNKYLKFYVKDEDLCDFLEELILMNKIIKDEDRFYLKEIYDAELTISEKINYLVKKPIDTYKKMDSYINDLEIDNNIKYNDKQTTAIKKALENNIVIITGGPGTGKTTIIKAIVEIYKRINKLNNMLLEDKLALLAPTGRASKRMSLSTNYSASTIHRFLKWNKEINEFGINEYNKDNSNLIIVDEASMIDINLFNCLLKGLTNNIKLVLVGDINQLPSVGPGTVLKDLIESGKIDTVYLDLLYRQSEDSYINNLALDIKNNSISDNYLNEYNDFKFLGCSSNSIIPSLDKICNQLLEKNYDYKQLQIMAPMYAGVNGIDNLNKFFQNIFNPSSKEKRELISGNIVFRENDKILQLKNMPDENVYNGDVGIIERICYASESESKKDEIYVNYDGNIVKYLPKDFQSIKHGYVVSIHKSQGSEFDLVIMIIVKEHRRMLYRKLIYTGVTRAKRKLIIIGEDDAFLAGINNNNEYLRKTYLKTRMECIK